MNKNSIEEDMKILEGIIKGDEDCINTIYSQMKVKNDNDEDIQYYKKEIQSIKNIVDNYLKEKARADKLEKEYSAMLTESDENGCDYKRVLKENEELKEYKKIAELTKISCCTAQNCEALNNAIKSELENQKLKEELNDINQKWIQKVKDKIEEINKNLYTVEHYETVGAINVLQELLEGRK